MADTKKYWKEIVEPEDIDAHMVEAGQAEVNALLVKRMMKDFPLPTGATLYVPGCGTGQIFDYVRPVELGKINFLFSDIKSEFLEKLKTRLPPEVVYRAQVDDIEETKIVESVTAALVVLLLQHIDWKLALRNIVATKPAKIFLIEQEQDAADSVINKNRELRPSMKKFAEIAKTELIPQNKLESFLEAHGYFRKWRQIESVPFSKRMFGMVFENHK